MHAWALNESDFQNRTVRMRAAFAFDGDPASHEPALNREDLGASADENTVCGYYSDPRANPEARRSLGAGE